LIPLNEEAKPRKEKTNPHQRKSRQKQVPPPKSINRIHRRQSKNPIYNARTQTGNQGRNLREPGINENLTRIISNDVDTAKLLHKHHEEGGSCRPTVAGDEEEFSPEVLAFAHFVLDEEGGVDGVEIA
jgi:hypothetical protein